MTREVFVVLHKVGSEKRPAWALDVASVGPLGRDSMNLGVKDDRKKLDPLARVGALLVRVVSPEDRVAPRVHSCEEWREDSVGCAVCHAQWDAALDAAEARGRALGVSRVPQREPTDYELLLLEMYLARATDELCRIPELRREDELQLVAASLATVREWRARGSSPSGAAPPPDATPCVQCGVTMYNGGTATGLCAACHRKAYPSLYGGGTVRWGDRPAAPGDAMTDQRQPYLIVRPARKPTPAELKKGEPDNQATVLLKEPLSGDEKWFHLELATVWPLELD